MAMLAVFLALALARPGAGVGAPRLPWWIWLPVGVPVLLLTIDLSLARGGTGLVQSRRAALALLGPPRARQPRSAGDPRRRSRTSRSELAAAALVQRFAIWSTDVVVFGLWFWEIEAGGPTARLRAPRPAIPDLSSRRTTSRPTRRRAGGRRSGTTSTTVADELDRCTTDTMPMSPRKALMGVVGDLGRDGAPRRGPRGQRPRLVNPRKRQPRPPPFE